MGPFICILVGWSKINRCAISKDPREWLVMVLMQVGVVYFLGVTLDRARPNADKDCNGMA